jgi:DNA-directed RNA polymerase subunit L
MALTITPMSKIKCNIKFTDIDYTIVNAIRRALISTVPVYAFDTIDIQKNTTNLDDDMLSHRLSLIPVEKQMDISFDFENTTSDNINIYTDDFIRSDDKWVCPGILVTIIKPSQSLKFSASSIVGCGKTHAKWSCITYEYKQYETVIFNGLQLEQGQLVDTMGINIDDLQSRLPTLFNSDGKLIADKILIDENLFNVINELVGSEIIVRSDDPIFEITLETVNNYTAIDTLKSAITELIKECRQCNYDIVNDGIIIHHDYSLVYMIVEQYRKYFKHNISGIKVHPLDSFMKIKSNSPTFIHDLKTCLTHLDQELSALLQTLPSER